MKVGTRRIVSGFLVLVPFFLRAETGLPAPPPFDRYGVILERKPFGEEALLTPAIDSSKPLVPPDQSFTAKYKMVAVTRNDQGVIQVGLVELKNNRSTMLGIGESLDGVEIVEADYVGERARLRREPEDYWVSMKGGSNQYDLVRKEALSPAPDVAASGVAPVPVVRKTGHRSSYAARRQSREEARIRKELARLQALENQRVGDAETNEVTAVASVRSGKMQKQPASLSLTGQALLERLGQAEDSEMSPEEVNDLLQEYQKELIRSGQTPLPIPLTPETDQQLVDEGVLPPQE